MEIIPLEIISASIVLFAVIDILGSLPIIINLKNQNNNHIHAFKATWVALAMLIVFLFMGKAILSLLGVNIESFAIAGSIVLLILAFEMISDRELFKHESPSGASIVPIAFPLIAGPGTFTSLLSLRAEFQTINIIIALLINHIIIYLILRSTAKVEHILGVGGIYILKKFFGIILLAMAIKLFMTNFAAMWISIVND